MKVIITLFQNVQTSRDQWHTKLEAETVVTTDGDAVLPHSYLQMEHAAGFYSFWLEVALSFYCDVFSTDHITVITEILILTLYNFQVL
jgi:hypothetical protein